MDRDLAIQLLGTLDDIKDALDTIATNTTPAAASASVESNNREQPEEITEEPEPESEPTRKGGK